jgi:4-hydroxybenzoyl-CoA reductase subunit beta
MDGFDLVNAASYAEARSLWHDRAMYVAGGTDLLPNLKHRIVRPTLLIDLAGIAGTVRRDADTLVLDAGLRLADLATNPLVLQYLPPLARAASLVAGPQIRNMGTLGGNILLDTRCLYYNQTEFWRQALGFCLKAEGTWCHVVGGPKTCVAAQSSDTVPVLLALDARLRFVDGAEVAIRELYRFNGMDHLKLAPGALLTEVRVPSPRPGFRGSYEKLRTRDSIDFPQLGLAVTGHWEGRTPRTLDIVVGAANPQPKPVRGLDPFLGAPLATASIDAIADLVYQQTRPQAAVHGDPAWRRQMAAVFTRRALSRLAGGG